jgi:hypothetical protein
MVDPLTVTATLASPAAPLTLTTSVLTNMLATAIAPVTLVSGITFLTSVMANRYGRCIDRIRALIKEIPQIPDPSKRRDDVVTQINILYTRTRTLRTTMTLGGISIFCVVLTVFGSFSNMLLHFPSASVIAAVFLASLLCLVGAVSGFIRDILVSLRAVKIEIKGALNAQTSLKSETPVTFNPNA